MLQKYVPFPPGNQAGIFIRVIQDLGETIFVCAVTLIMRFLYSRKEIVSFNVKARIYRFLKT